MEGGGIGEERIGEYTVAALFLLYEMLDETLTQG